MNQPWALFDRHIVRVYQAFSDEIADAALEAGTFVSPFKMSRMTWIKPSFLWMMYRSGWGRKDALQRRVLAIDISREGFDWAIAHGRLSHQLAHTTESKFNPLIQRAPVIIQLDPDRDARLRPLKRRAIQIGLRDEALRRYIGSWIQSISDVSDTVSELFELFANSEWAELERRLPKERQYPSALWNSVWSPLDKGLPLG